MGVPYEKYLFTIIHVEQVHQKPEYISLEKITCVCSIESGKSVKVNDARLKGDKSIEIKVLLLDYE